MARARTTRRLKVMGVMVAGVLAGIGIGLLLVRLIIEN